MSFPSFIKPIAVPLTRAFKGTPASNNESVLPQTYPIEVDTFELKTSLTTLKTYGKGSLPGRTGIIALSANAPCPISLLPGVLIGLVSPTE